MIQHLRLRKKRQKKKKKVSKKKESTVGTIRNRRNNTPTKPSNAETKKEQAKPTSNARVAKKTKDEKELINNTPAVNLKRVGDYINVNGKLYHNDTLRVALPDLHLRLGNPVMHGNRFPQEHTDSELFLRTDFLPTKLYRSNGQEWELQDKNIITRTAYTAEYIQLLVDKIAEGEYNPELLNDIEKQLIKEQIADEF